MSERTNSRTSRKKAQRQLRMKRVLLTASLMVLVAVVSIGGTIAWLQDGTETITNTFAPTGIGITLTETKNGPYKLIPGEEYDKNPTVSVLEKTDVDIYLFVKFVEEGTPDTYLDYTSSLNADKGWTLVTGESDVWYRKVAAGATVRNWELLDDNKVTVKTTLEKEQMPDPDKVKLSYTAYAIQTAGFEDAAAAWAVAKTYSAN